MWNIAQHLQARVQQAFRGQPQAIDDAESKAEQTANQQAFERTSTAHQRVFEQTAIKETVLECHRDGRGGGKKSRAQPAEPRGYLPNDDNGKRYEPGCDATTEATRKEPHQD